MTPQQKHDEHNYSCPFASRIGDVEKRLERGDVHFEQIKEGMATMKEEQKEIKAEQKEVSRSLNRIFGALAFGTVVMPFITGAVLKWLFK